MAFFVGAREGVSAIFQSSEREMRRRASRGGEQIFETAREGTHFHFHFRTRAAWRARRAFRGKLIDRGREANGEEREGCALERRYQICPR